MRTFSPECHWVRFVSLLARLARQRDEASGPQIRYSLPSGSFDRNPVESGLPWARLATAGRSSSLAEFSPTTAIVKQA